MKTLTGMFPMNCLMLWLYRLMTWWLPESRGFGYKNFLLRLSGARIGKNVRIYTSARIFGAGFLEIGDDVHIGPETMIYTSCDAKVVIGNCVDIASRVTILTGSHEVDPDGAHIAGKGTSKDVVIGDGCWIGANATVFGGVTFHEKTIVAAGSVVLTGADRGLCLLAGAPAEVRKTYG